MQEREREREREKERISINQHERTATQCSNMRCWKKEFNDEIFFLLPVLIRVDTIESLSLFIFRLSLSLYTFLFA
jgi:hypothetical protein